VVGGRGDEETARRRARPRPDPEPRLRLGVLASGRGTNLEAILSACERGELDAEVAVVICDRREAEALLRAERHGVKAMWLDPAPFPSRRAYDERLVELLRQHGVDLVVLAGYMRIVGPALLEAFPWRVMNIHPALLPSFPGKDGQRQAVEHGVKVSGCTVHFVDGGVDTGPIILQRVVPVLEGDTAETLAERILAEEHRAYPEAIRLFAEGRLEVVDGRRVRILPEPESAETLEDREATPETTRGRRRRALLSVHDKTGLVDFARGLVEAGFELVSSGGTARVLAEAGLPVLPVEDVTGFPEMLGGRVKTLHPAIHGGILARRDLPEHMDEIDRHGIVPVDLVAVNLYPFQATVNRLADGGPGEPGDHDPTAFAEIIENIDIGGPTLIRAAAKNHESVVVVTDPSLYPAVLDHLRREGEVPLPVRRALALRAFQHTAFYDAVISSYLEEVVAREAGGTSAAGVPAAGGAPVTGTLPERIVLAYEKAGDLRYGENPHQHAAFYRQPLRPVLDALGATLPGATQLQGKPLSYNNLGDAEAALRCVEEFPEAPAAVIVKHMTPCGVAVAEDALTAYRRALESDPVSAFGGIVALNRPVDRALAEELLGLFLEVVLAPDFEPEALDVLCKRPDLRLLALPVGAARWSATPGLELRSVGGGLLVQTPDVIRVPPDAWKCVTARRPTPAELGDLFFAWRVSKHVRSNAIAVARGGRLLGVGGGQTNRVDAVRLAVGHAGERARGAVLASDAFFPFPDSVEEAARAGITAVVQPGGSVRDEAVIRAADAAGVAMVFTGERHFKH